MKETFDDIVRNENIPLPIVKPSNVDQLILEHNQIASRIEPLYEFHDSLAEEETDDGFEDELSDSHQDKMRYKIEELNAQLAADPTPVESNRQRHVTFKENLVDIMDSNSCHPSPDLLGDEDINEKSLEEIQMLSQKPLLEELSPYNDSCNEHKNFEKDYVEQEHEPGDLLISDYTESVENLKLEATDENEMKNDSDETKNSKCELNEEIASNENKMFDEVKNSECDADENVNKFLIEETDCITGMKTLLNENNDDKNLDKIPGEIISNEINSDSAVDNINKLQHDSSSIEIEDNINDINLSSSNHCKHANENIESYNQSSFNSTMNELVTENTYKEQNENKYPDDLDEKENEHVSKILELNDGLEQSSSNIACNASEYGVPSVSNIDPLTDKKHMPEKDHTDVDIEHYEKSKEDACGTEQSLKINEFNEQIIPSSKSIISTSVETKATKPSVTSKSKASSKLKKSTENQSCRKLPNYRGNPRSQYGLSKEECKDLMHIRKEKLSQMKMKEKEEEENRILKQEEAQKAFAAWLSKKKMQEKFKNKKVTKIASLKEVPTKEENKKEYGDAEEAFQSWLKKKEQQISKEEILKQLEEEEKALNQCRTSRREAAKAFNKWLVKKQKDQHQENKRMTLRGNYLNSLPLQARHIEAFAQTFHAYLGNTM